MWLTGGCACHHLCAGWSRRQYLALLHLYMFEVLLFEMREVSEVVRWLEATQLPVEQDDKQVGCRIWLSPWGSSGCQGV